MAGNFRNARALVNADGSYAYGSKAWCERQVIIVIQGAMRGRNAGPDPAMQPVQPRDYRLAITGVMTLARLKGYIVEQKRSLAAKVDLSQLPAGDLQALLKSQLDQIDPASRAQIESMAAGDYDATAEPLD